jgi:putative hemolysin
MDFLLILLLTALNAAFAMSEMALTASRKTRLMAMAEAGDTGAAAALRLMAEPTRLLSTVQIGITSIGVLNGIVGEAAFSDAVAAFFRQGFGLSAASAALAATALVVALITCLTIIFGELVPKRIGQLYPEPVARWVAKPMRVLALLTAPLVKFLTLSTQGVLKLLRVNTHGADTVTEEEISASLQEGVNAGVIEAQEHQMVRNVFHLDERALASMMLPRDDMVWLEAKHSVAEALAQILALGVQGGYSWYPVCRGGLDDVVGIVSLAQLLAAQGSDADQAPAPQSLLSTQTLQTLAQPAVFVPETLNGLELLGQFKNRQRQEGGGFVLVVDEYGVVQGMVTAFDLLEAITGELQVASSSQAWATQRADGAWLLDGQMPVSELKTQLGLKSLPDEASSRYNTLGGLLMSLMGRLPQASESVQCGGWRFEVLRLEGRRIDQVLATTAPAAQSEA